MTARRPPASNGVVAFGTRAAEPDREGAAHTRDRYARRVGDNKTRPTSEPVNDYLGAVKNARRRADAEALTALMAAATGARPTMWGAGIVGFGTHHYSYATGREGDTVAVGFAARTSALVLYGLQTQENPNDTPLLAELGPHTVGSGCLYLKTLDGVNLEALGRMVAGAYQTRNTPQVN